jgi:hypothetical protein
VSLRSERKQDFDSIVNFLKPKSSETIKPKVIVQGSCAIKHTEEELSESKPVRLAKALEKRKSEYRELAALRGNSRNSKSIKSDNYPTQPSVHKSQHQSVTATEPDLNASFGQTFNY